MKLANVVFWTILTVVSAATAPGFTTTYVPMSDEDLLSQATLVIEADIVETAPALGGAATDYRVAIRRALKSPIPSGRITVRFPGGEGPAGRISKVWGVPGLQVGQRTLLFLAPRGDGTFGPLHLGLGVFYELEAQGETLAVRDLAGASVVRLAPHAAGSSSEEDRQLRSFDRFADWLAVRARGGQRAADYFVFMPERPDLRPPRLSESFTLLGGSTPFRWFDFDGGSAVPWHAHRSGVAGMDHDEFVAFRVALEAWNADEGSEVLLSYAGLTDADQGFLAVDGINTILWDDPNDEIAGSFDCASGGVLAIGGVTSASGTGEHGGETFYRIREGDVVTQDGAGCFFDSFAGANGSEVFGHEIGHAMGFGHSCGDSSSGPCDGSPEGDDDALMRAVAHGGGRGAELGVDDRNALCFSYGLPECAEGASADGSVTPGLFSPVASWFYLRNENTGGPANKDFGYGPPDSDWTPLAGDWNGDGLWSIGLFAPATSTFYLRDSNEAGPADHVFDFGPPGAGWTPLAGDWNGDGITTVGLYDPSTSTFHLRNALAPGSADLSLSYGPAGAGWFPLAGDWNGDGTSSLGLFDPVGSTFHLRNSLSGGPADVTFDFGPPGAGWEPLAGDWNATGSTGVGLFDPSSSYFYLRNLLVPGAAEKSFAYGPPGSGWMPVPGNWDGR